MSSVLSVALSGAKSNGWRAIVWSGLACGILDISAAFVVYGHYRLKPLRLLQGIAAGLLGTKAFEGGAGTAALGLFCHFVIAFLAASIFYMASRAAGLLVEHEILSGALYGVAVYFFMQLVVLPLSHAVRRPFSFKFMVIGVVIHIFCVGLPIALAARRYSDR